MRLEYELMDRFERLTNVNERKLTRCIQENNPTGLTDMQAITLQYIMVESKKRDVFAKDIEEYFDIKASSVSSLIGYLEKSGYITRIPLEDDRRNLRLIVTPKGDAIEEWLMDVIDRSIIGGFTDFTDHEMQLLLSLFDKLIRNFTRVAEQGYPVSED